MDNKVDKKYGGEKVSENFLNCTLVKNTNRGFWGTLYTPGVFCKEIEE